MSFTIEDLRARLGGRAPGRRAAPGSDEAAPPLPRGDHDLEPDTWTQGRVLTPAAVLVPLVAEPAGFSLLLTKRTTHLRDHAGQVAFPGGRAEPEDGSPETTALREAMEEIGLRPDQVTLLGRLDTYVTGTGYEVTPVVGLLTPPLVLRPDPHEGAEIFQVPLDFFLQPASRQLMSREWKGRSRQFYAYPYGDYFIWGATAGMVNNLAELLAAALES